MRYFSQGEDKYHGTCRPLSSKADGCHNQIYFIRITRMKNIDYKTYFERRVLSIGIIWRGYGRVFDIPLSRWELVVR